MASSSPYAPFKAEAWMRATVIAPRKPVLSPRKQCPGTVGSRTPARATRSVSMPMKKAGTAIRACSWIQGDLFQASPHC